MLNIYILKIWKQPGSENNPDLTLKKFFKTHNQKTDYVAQQSKPYKILEKVTK